MLSDWVMFECYEAILYLEYQDLIDMTRVSHAEFILNKVMIKKM